MPGTRAFHKLLEISQEVSRNFSKSCLNVAKQKKSKDAFCDERCSKDLKKETKPFVYPPPLFDLKQNYANCIKQSKEFLNIIVQF